MDLSPIKSSSSHHSSHASFPIIAVAIIGIVATAFLLVGYYIFVIKCCLNWHRIDLLRRFSFSRRRRMDNPLMANHSPVFENRGLGEAAIRSIPIFNFKKKEEKSCECAVCLNEFQESEKLKIVPNCGHFFHIDCIDVWLQNNANCPLCRTSISGNSRFFLPAGEILAPSSSQDSNHYSESFTGRDEDYVIIEIGSEERSCTNPSLARVQENLNSNELLKVSPLPKSKKKFSHVSSMGDEWIDNRKKDEQFAVQPIRRSFSMDSAADGQLYLAVQEIMQQQKQVIFEISPSEGGSRVKRSFFSFGQGRGSSRNAVQPVALEP